MAFLQGTFSPLVLIFTVSNLAAMGLQVSMPEVLVALKNRVAMVLIFVWGWVLGPVGMVLSVPLTMIVKIAMDSSEDTRWMAMMLGPAPPGAVPSLSKSDRKEQNGA